MKRGIVAAAMLIVAAGLSIWVASRTSAPEARPAPVVRAATASVRTAELQQGTISVAIESSGTVGASEAIEIVSQISGIVEEIGFKEASYVHKGDLIARLDSTKVRAELAEAEAALENTTNVHLRGQDLARTGVLSLAQMQQLDADLKRDGARVAGARARLMDTLIRAPFSGRVGLRRISVGALVVPGTVITTLDDISTVKVDFTVPELAMAALRAGQEVRARSSAYPDRDFVGHVESVDSRIDASTRAVLVRARFDNEQAHLTPGMFVSVTLHREHRAGLIAPESALIPDRGKQYVYVVKDALATRREVVTGHRAPGIVEIVSGADAGERVVVDGAVKLRDGIPVVEAAQAETALESG